MNQSARNAFVLTVCAALACLPASATCGITNNRSFGGYTYYQGFEGTEADLLGSYWVLGSFATANSGATTPADWMNTCTGGDCGAQAVFLAGSWADSPAIVGCPPDHPATPKMIFQISGAGPSGGTVYGAGCTSPDPLSTNYNFGNFTPTPVPMQAIPQPTVRYIECRPGPKTVFLAKPNLPGGVVNEGNCNLGPIGYRIYGQYVPWGNPPPASRLRQAGWIPQGGINPIGSEPSPIVNNCGGDLYVSFSVVLNDGQELAHVGPNSIVVPCDCTHANQPIELKRKPIRRPTTEH